MNEYERWDTKWMSKIINEISFLFRSLRPFSHQITKSIHGVHGNSANNMPLIVISTTCEMTTSINTYSWMKGQKIDKFKTNDNRVLWVTKENRVRNSPDSSFLRGGDFPTGGKPRQREENSTNRHGDVRDTTEKVNARMQKARCPQQLESCRLAASPASKRSSIDRAIGILLRG